jgi:RNA polymerase sigma factor (sigma-70 family)
MKEPLDHSWFQAVYDLHRGQIFGKCFLLLRNREDAQDVTDETFLRALADPKFSSLSRDHQRNWLFLTARRICFDMLDRPKPTPPDQDEEGWELKIVGRDPTPEDFALHAELNRKLRHLSKEEWYAAIAHVSGCTFKEIGAALGCSTAMAFNHYQNALTKLKRLYEDDRD